jgi:hypothetical protein
MMVSTSNITIWKENKHTRYFLQQYHRETKRGAPLLAQIFLLQGLKSARLRSETRFLVTALDLITIYTYRIAILTSTAVIAATRIMMAALTFPFIVGLVLILTRVQRRM